MNSTTVCIEVLSAKTHMQFEREVTTGQCNVAYYDYQSKEQKTVTINYTVSNGIQKRFKKGFICVATGVFVSRSFKDENGEYDPVPYMHLTILSMIETKKLEVYSVVSQVGRVVLPPDENIKTFATGKYLAENTIAINYGKDAQGNSLANFYRIKVWNKQADVFCNYVKLGYEVAVTGKLDFEVFQNKAGETVIKPIVTADSITLLNNRGVGQGKTTETQAELVTA